VSAALLFRAADRQVFKLDAPVVRRLHDFRQTQCVSREAGGVLLGRWLRESEHVVVDELTTPMRGDRRGRTSFHRAAQAHQQRIDRAYAESHGTCGYLGEWHTHPEADPTPSSVDLDDWRRRLRDDRVDVPHLFFVIVGTSSTRAWRGERTTLGIESLEAVELCELDPTETPRPLHQEAAPEPVDERSDVASPPASR
jgi:integrative and conjugative element protein (TIGR02256 family)